MAQVLISEPAERDLDDLSDYIEGRRRRSLSLIFNQVLIASIKTRAIKT